MTTTASWGPGEGTYSAPPSMSPVAGLSSPLRPTQLLCVGWTTIAGAAYPPHDFALSCAPSPLEALSSRIAVWVGDELALPALVGTAVRHTEFSFDQPRLIRFSTHSKRSGSASSFARRSGIEGPRSRVSRATPPTRCVQDCPSP